MTLPKTENQKPKTAPPCGRCHTCGEPLRRLADGSEYCDPCQTWRRYRSHGYESFALPGCCPANLGRREETHGSS